MYTHGVYELNFGWKWQNKKCAVYVCVYKGYVDVFFTILNIFRTFMIIYNERNYPIEKIQCELISSISSHLHHECYQMHWICCKANDHTYSCLPQQQFHVRVPVLKQKHWKQVRSCLSIDLTEIVQQFSK